MALFADAGTIASHLSVLSAFFRRECWAHRGSDHPGCGQGSDTLGLAFVIGLLVALWSANSGVAALFDALNVVYDEKEKRSLVRFYGRTFLFTLGGIGFVIAAVSGVVVLPLVLKLFGSTTSAGATPGGAALAVLLGVVVVSLAFLYRYGPSRRDAKWRWVTWGSVVAALLWIGASMAFSGAIHFDSYNKTYGSRAWRSAS